MLQPNSEIDFTLRDINLACEALARELGGVVSVCTSTKMEKELCQATAWASAQFGHWVMGRGWPACLGCNPVAPGQALK